MPLLIKKLIFTILLAIPDSLGCYFEWLACYSKLGKWAEDYIKPYDVETYENRFLLYDAILQENAQDEIVYLEYGVFQGESIKYFSTHHPTTSSVFFGFDTFTGLPEDWNASVLANVKSEVFDVQGKLPQIEDSRVKFCKGLFSQTMPSFKIDNKEILEQNIKLIIHIDADLYSSTLYVLTEMQEYIVAGTIIIFDEFRSVIHEFKAFTDFCKSHGRYYRVKGVTDMYTQVAVEML
jgi:O-methyltransferase